MNLSPNTIVLKNLNYIDVSIGKVIEEKDILIKNGIICDIGKFDWLYGADFIDCANLWAIPSFVDAHVHITFNPYEIDSISKEYIVGNLSDAASAGICMVRDLGMAQSFNKSDIDELIIKLPLPHVIYSGSPICVENGHGNDYGVVLAENEIENWMCLHKSEGYEWVKVMNDPENHSICFLKLITEMAHKYGLKVACHAFTKKGIESAIVAKCDTVEHSVPLNYDIVIETETVFVPTYYSAYVSKSEYFIAQMNNELEIEYLIQWYEYLNKGLPYAIQKSIPIICGSDGGSCPSTFHDITNEIKILFREGMSFIQALSSATLLPAKIMGHDDKFGSIEKGKYANIILLNGNPVEDITNLDYKSMILLFGHKIRDEVSLRWN